jgi:hypothetical protein
VTSPTLTPEQHGLQVALKLHRSAPPKTWQAAINAIDDPQARAAAQQYLDGIAYRIRVIRSLPDSGRKKA